MIICSSGRPKFYVILFILNIAHLCKAAGLDLTTKPKSTCSVFKEVGVNDLSVNDIVVKNSASNIACIKAKFSLAIKVEEYIGNATNDNGNQTESQKIVLGYLPLDSVVSVEDSCPSPQTNDSRANQSQNGDQNGHVSHDEPQELEMIIVFECGKLAFNFKREDNVFLSSIKGVVNLDSNIMREFIAERPMFFTSDLSHHFKFNDLIEVESTVKTKAFILTADFYNLELEAFRNTSSRDFIRPPDDQSIPFLK